MYRLGPIRNNRRRAPEENVAALAYERLKTAILSGQLKPGTRLREIPLSEALGVSRTPLRMAMGRLEIERLVNASPSGGRVVTNPTQHEIADIYEARVALEAATARLTAERATGFERQVLAQLCRRMTEAAREDDLQLLGTLNAQFHTLIAEYSHNAYLKSFVEVLRNAGQQVSATALQLPGRARTVLREHIKIFDCIKSRDPDGAAAAMSQHLQGTREARIMGHLLKGSAPKVKT